MGKHQLSNALRGQGSPTRRRLEIAVLCAGLVTGVLFTNSRNLIGLRCGNPDLLGEYHVLDEASLSHPGEDPDGLWAKYKVRSVTDKILEHDGETLTLGLITFHDDESSKRFYADLQRLFESTKPGYHGPSISTCDESAFFGAGDVWMMGRKGSTVILISAMTEKQITNLAKDALSK